MTPAETRKAALRQSITRFLADLDPTWFVTVTFAGDVPDPVAHREFQGFSRHLARDVYRSHISIGWTFAPQARDVQHFHALLAPHEHEAHVTAEDIRRAWPHGSVDVQAVHDAAGAAEYMVRHVDVSAADIRRGWVMNVACPRETCCRRRRGCTVAPGPWRWT